MKTEAVSSLGENVRSLEMILGLLYFIFLMISDVYKAIRSKPRRIWIPGKSLVLSALTIQILSYLEIYLIHGDNEYVQESVFVGESGRVVMCVLLGYLLPEMALVGAATDWSTLSALILTLFTSEFYYLIYAFNENILGSKFYLYRLVTNVVLVVSIILMVLFSICTILAGKTIRGMLTQRICAIQWDKSNKCIGDSWEKFEGEIVESWLLARVCNPQYVIARSILVSAVGVVVTICIFFLAILQFCLYWVDGGFFFFNFELSMTAWTISWAFILVGEAAIFWRWFTAVVYFPKVFVRKERKERQTCPRPFVEDFWTRSVSELIEMYNLQQEQKKNGNFEGLLLRLATTLNLHNLFSLLKPLQILLICFCKCCFFISEFVFRLKFVWYYVLGSDKVLFQPQGEFEEYREILEKVCMPGENWENLWIANEKTMKQAKHNFSTEKGKEKGTNCDKLFEFIRSHLKESGGEGRFVNQLESFPLVAKHFPALDENCMRMTALSLLTVIKHLLSLHGDVDKLDKAIEAYEQYEDLMSFVDNSDPERPTTINMFKVIDIEADRVGVAVRKEFKSLREDLQKKKPASSQKSPDSEASQASEIIKKKKQAFLQKSSDSEAPQASEIIKKEEQAFLKKSPNSKTRKASEIINELLEKAKNKLKEQGLPITGLPITEKERQTDGEEEQTVREEYCDSRDWSAIAASYSKYRVCKLILSRHNGDEHELMDYLYNSLSDVFAYCLLKLPNVMVKTCREWAVHFEEQKIWDAMSTAGKFVGLMEKCNVEAKANFLQPYKDTKNKETQTGEMPLVTPSFRHDRVHHQDSLDDEINSGQGSIDPSQDDSDTGDLLVRSPHDESEVFDPSS